MKDNTTEGKKDCEDIGPRGFDYKLFEKEEGGGFSEGLEGYPYLKHLILLRPGDWAKQMEK